MKNYTFYTDGSTAPGNPGPSGYGFYGTDDNLLTYSGYGPVGMLTTNNVAEIMAIHNLLYYLLKESLIGNVIIYSDSEYAINILKDVDNKAKNNWKTLIGSPMANRQYWVDLYELILLYKSKAGSLTFKWIKGHNGTYENEMADTNANKGRASLINGDSQHVCNVTIGENVSKLPDNQTKTITAKKKSSPKLNGLFAAKRWFFRTNENLDHGGYQRYLGMSYPNDKKLDHKNAGKRNPNTHYCILLTPNSIDIFDQLKVIFDNYYSSLYLPVVVELVNLCNKKVWDNISEFGHEFTVIKDDQALHMDNTLLGKVLQPPRKSYALDDIFLYGHTLLDKYMAKDSNTFILDITDNLIKTDAKSKRSIVESFKSQSDIILIPGIEISKDIITDIKLLVNLDIFSRTNLLQLINEKKIVKIEVMAFDINPLSYRVATVVKVNDDTCIYFTPDANYRFITQYKNKFDKTKVKNFIASSKLEGIEAKQPILFTDKNKE